MFSDENRPIQFTTPLGKDKLLVTGFSGREMVSGLFRYYVEAVTEDRDPIAFEQLLGQKVTVAVVATGGTRYFNGMVTGVTQRVREEVFTQYGLELAPTMWKLTRNTNSVIYQQQSVVDILKAVFSGYEVDFTKLGTYQPREYCVQYRETDFNFASRLMEEEGIFYFFEHTSSTHKMILGDSPQAFAAIAYQPDVIYETAAGGGRPEDRILAWEKAQDLRSGKSTLWDYKFEMPTKNCEAVAQTLETVQAGTITHKLNAGTNSAWELYDYPGAYAKRFDGIDKSGGDQASNLQKIFDDNTRTVKLRMEAETAGAMTILGQGVHTAFTPGYTFNLTRHFTDNGEYSLLAVEHEARQSLGQDEDFRYHNSFRAIPGALPYRPPRITAEPFVHGPQTAVVVGPSGEEIFTDKYGRVKVQFPWDRKGQKDATSSCWLRVATHWAGKQWGAVHIPRIGQEVIVGFLEGDPDQPIIIGSVYNADNMAPWTLPDNKTQSGIKSRSSKSGGSANYNEVFFEDKMGAEMLRIHAEKDQMHEVENDDAQWVGHDRTTKIDNDETRTVKGKQTITITGDQTLEITQGNQTNTIDQGNQSTTLKMGNQDTELKMGNQSTKVDLGTISMEAMQSITLKVGQSKITIDQMGITLEGMMIKVNAQIQYQEQAVMIQSQASGMMQIQGAITMIN